MEDRNKTPVVRRSTRISSRTPKPAPTTTGISTSIFYGVPTPSPTEFSASPPGRCSISSISSASSPLCTTWTPDSSADTSPLNTETTIIPNLTCITIEDADLRSQPYPGQDLIRLVRAAKASGEIARPYNLGIVRLVDGNWMVPQKCKNCQVSGEVCNRERRCNTCKKNSKECETSKEDCMVVIGTRNPVQNSGISGSIGTINHGALGQNENGTWFHVTGEAPESRTSAITPTQRRRASRPLPGKLAIELDTEFMEIDDTEGDSASSSGRQHKRKGAAQEATHSTKRFKSTPAKQPATEKGSHVEVQLNNPEPQGKAPVLSNTRQALCETLPWFRAYQSSAYSSDGVIHGIMFDMVVGPRDYIGDAVIISRVGGGKVPDENGNMVQTKDQSSSIVGSFKRTMQSHKPVGVIIGLHNTKSPVKWEAYYNVLDWFHITDVWCEKINALKTFMFRLEKVDLLEPSWWSPKDTQYVLPNYSASKTPVAVCVACQKESKSIYNHGWTCLNEGCPEHFRFTNAFDETTLTFVPTFLGERTDYLSLAPQMPGSIAPTLPAKDDLESSNIVDEEIFGIEKQFKRGIVCPNCTHCIQRLEWKQWACTNCSYTYAVPQKVVGVDIAIARSSKLPTRESTIYLEPGRLVQQLIFGLYDVYLYPITGESAETVGYVAHYKSHPTINEQKDGPDDLFRQMQELDLGMKRGAARQKGKPGQMVTSHFATNWGAPYKYGVAQDSKGFDEAPLTIIKALKRLTWAGKHAISQCTQTSEDYNDPNELLTIGYFEESTIGYHDDGEKELGPTVVSLSLGSSATMCWRPKAKSAIAKGRSKNQKGTKPDVLQIQLDHGDIMVMHGAKIQELYEHAVTPHGKIRFALTSRYMVPAKIKDDTDRELAAVKGALPTGHDQYDYHGDEPLQPRPDRRTRFREAWQKANVYDVMEMNGKITKEEAVRLRTQAFEQL